MSKSIILRRHGGSDGGTSIVMVLVFTAICLIVLAAALDWAMTNTQLTQRHCQYNRSMAAAEAATEKVLSAIAMDYRNQGQGYVMTNIAHYRALYPTPDESSVWRDYLFMDTQGTTNATDVQYIAGSTFTVLTSQYRGLRGFANSFRVISDVRQINSTLGTVGAVQQEVQLSTIPLFQFAIFYNLDLECNALPVMVVTGPVYCNASVYLTPASSLTFNSDVMASGQIYLTAKTGNPIPPLGGTVIFNGAHDSGVSTLSLPIGTNNSSAAVHQVIEVPPAGESPLSSQGQQRYYNKADMIILVTNNAVVVKSGLDNNFATSIPWLQATQFIKTNITFTNGREAKTVRATEIDIARLILWNATNNLLRSVIPTHDIRTLFVADQRTQTASTQSGVRLINGQTLLPQGLTVATPNPIYILGNYNCPTAALGTTNTSGTLPASVVADAITVLSTAWIDGNSGGSLASRVAGDTTVNAAFLGGIVQTTVPLGYSGGVENFPRFLEEWTNKTLTYNGSMVVMFDSQIATAPWVNIGTYYNPPVRNWAFDQNFLVPTKLPPETPSGCILVRGSWRVAQPGSTNVVVTL